MRKGVLLSQVDCEDCGKTAVKGYNFQCDMNYWHYYCIKCSKKKRAKEARTKT